MVVHFWIEIYSYLNKKNGYIKKHISRDKWIRKNIDAFSKYLKMDLSDYSIKSCFTTDEALTIKFIKSKDLGIPFIDYYELKEYNSEAFLKRAKTM